MVIHRLIQLLTIAVGMFIAQTVQAQHRYNAWFRSTLSIPVGDKIIADNEFQHRRQSGFDNENLFDENLMFSYRHWVHYQHSENIRFSVSPFAYFKHYRIIQNHSDETAKPNSEVRFSMAMELQHQLLERIYLVNRTAVEYRVFNNQKDITRLRNRLGVYFGFTERMTAGIFEEPLANITGVTHKHIFDHNRIGVNLEYKIVPNLKMDLGYMYISRLPLSSTTMLHENNFYLNLTYKLRSG